MIVVEQGNAMLTVLPSLKFSQAAPGLERQETRIDSELLEPVRHVAADALAGDRQAPGDLGVRGPLEDRSQNDALAVGQRGGPERKEHAQLGSTTLNVDDPDLAGQKPIPIEGLGRCGPNVSNSTENRLRTRPHTRFR